MSEITVALKRLHPAQEEIIRTAKRFNILKCGRRFGKTVLAEEIAVQCALDGFPAGYWTPTYKDLYEVWNTLKTTLYDVIKRKDEQVKQIELITGGKIDFWSLDDPDSGRGRKYKVAIIDEAEKSSKLEQAWQGAIRPTLTDYGGSAWILSSPKFGRTYFKKLFEEAEKSEHWQTWRYTTYDNPTIPKDEIDLAKITLNKLYFDCEYMALDVDLVAMPFAYNFNKSLHVTKTTINPNVPFRFVQDFNVDPMANIMCQIWRDNTGHHIHFHREIALFNQGTPEIIEVVKTKYTPLQLATALWTGDATARKRTVEQTIKGTEHLHSWKLIDNAFRLGQRLQVPRGNPPVASTRELMNYILAVHPDVKFDESMSITIGEMLYTQVDNDGDLIKRDRNKPEERADFLDCIRYAFSTWLFDFIDNPNRYIK